MVADVAVSIHTYPTGITLTEYESGFFMVHDPDGTKLYGTVSKGLAYGFAADYAALPFSEFDKKWERTPIGYVPIGSPPEQRPQRAMPQTYGDW